MLSITNQILLVGIIVVITAIYNKIIFKQDRKEDILKESKEWKGTRENFINFKEYQYNQTFQLVWAQTPFIVFSIGIIFGLMNQLTSSLGIFPILAILICFSWVFLKSYMIIVPKASKTAIRNMKEILEQK